MSRRFNMTPSTDSSQAQPWPYRPRSMWVRASGPHPLQAAPCWHAEGPLRVLTGKGGEMTLGEKRGTLLRTPQVEITRRERDTTRTRQLEHAALVQPGSGINTSAVTACKNP